jgi:L-asparaginase
MIPERPHLSLISVGGTIGVVGTSRLDLTAYHETGERKALSDLVDSIPELGSIASIETIDFRRVSSTALSVEDWLDLLRLVESLIDDDDGIVITHGTNTLEETAFFLDLCLDTSTPVVLVGAMRPLSALSSDASLNLVRAVQVAASPEARGHGVLVAMNDQIFLARDVVKNAARGPAAFYAPNSGPIGSVDSQGRVVVDRRRVGGATRFDVSAASGLPRVDIVLSHVGADGLLVDAAVAGGARGIVSAGAGSGRPTPLEEEALKRASSSGVVVCLSSRVGSGTVAPTPGTLASRFVAARDLNPWKSRVLLSLALTRSEDPVQIQELFDNV